jgi:hypothetical protein
MDLSQRLELRDLLLGEDDAQRRALRDFLTSDHEDPEISRLVADVAPLVARLDEAVDQHLPYGTPREAVEHAISRSAGFSVAAVAEYCDADEKHGGEAINEVRRLLAEAAAEGRLTVEYSFDCPNCGNVIDHRDDLPDGRFTVMCEARCKAERVVDPATAHAVFMNTNQDPALESWI